MVAGGIVTYNGGPEESLNKFKNFCLIFNGLIQNHAAGVGGYIKTYLATLFVGTARVSRSSAVPRPIGNPIQRKSRTLASSLHVFSVLVLAVAFGGGFREKQREPRMDVRVTSTLLVNSSHGL